MRGQDIWHVPAFIILGGLQNKDFLFAPKFMAAVIALNGWLFQLVLRS